MDNRKREVQEALDAADNVLHCLSVARGQLSSASAFGMLDIASNNTADPFGLNMTARGVVPSVLKYSELQNASHQLTIAKAALDRLRAEVDDVIALPEVAQFDLISIADIIFDGFIPDMLAQSRIEEARSQVEIAFNQVLRIRGTLEEIKRNL